MFCYFWLDFLLGLLCWQMGDMMLVLMDRWNNMLSFFEMQVMWNCMVVYGCRYLQMDKAFREVI